MKLRKARALKQLKRSVECREVLTEVQRLDGNNKELKQLTDSLDEEDNRRQVDQGKEKAGELLKSGQVQEALIIYQDLLKKVSLTGFDDILLYCSLLLNKSVGHLRMEEYDDIISLCIRGVKIIKNFRNRVLSFEKITKDSKEKLMNFEVRFLTRRGNAYLKQG